ncbi:MAG: ABC transporter permease [Lachnospiraceae bacterium]|nr:ABC transporter permease [Lachnospiraceae bacterium]
MAKKRKIPVTEIIVSILAPVLLLVIWQISAQKGWVNKALLPAVTKIFDTAVGISETGKLPGHLLASLSRVVKGFLAGASLGIAIGTLMGFSKWVNHFLSSLVSLLRPIPMIAWIPIFILWMGIGELTKISVITLGTFWPVLLNTIQGICSVDNKLLEVAKVLKKKRKTIVLKVVFPAALPSIFTGLRLGMGAAWSCVVAAEMIAARQGIGFMITYARETAKPAEVFVGVFVIGLIGFFIDVLLRRLESHLLKWNTAGVSK